LTLGGELGVLGTWFGIAREDGAARTDLFSVGLRGSVIARLELGRWSPFVSADAEWAVPRYEISIVPDGTIGRLPPVWLGFSAGVAVTIR
jgi:hypothetical protein